VAQIFGQRPFQPGCSGSFYIITNSATGYAATPGYDPLALLNTHFNRRISLIFLTVNLSCGMFTFFFRGLDCHSF
ncbi:MAG: hypothetical protein MUO64_19535, partial [Anaerolineales bacterium]|nr:hypothetical protein [Anaerolineales bacterium]